MDAAEDFDPFKESVKMTASKETDATLLEEVARLQAKVDAFRSIADRFYMLWWNLPGMTLRQVDRDLQDMFRMYLELAPSLGVSRNGISELRECCGRKRVWKDEALSGDAGDVLVMAPVTEQKLGWCPGDIIRRISKAIGFKYCEKCDRRRRAINAFFRCGGA